MIYLSWLVFAYWVKSSTIYSDCGRLRYKGVGVDFIYNAEYLGGFVFASDYDYNFYVLFRVPSLPI